MQHEITKIIRNPNRPCGCIFGDVPRSQNRQNQASHSRYSQMYPASARYSMPLGDWGECIFCGVCSDVGHAWWCNRRPNPKPCAQKWSSQ